MQVNFTSSRRFRHADALQALREAMYSACKIIRGVRDPEIVRSGIYHEIGPIFWKISRAFNARTIKPIKMINL